MPPKKLNPKAAAAKKAADKAKSSAPVNAAAKAAQHAMESYRNATGVLTSRPRALDVKIGNFSLAAYGKELIKDTEIELTIGRRYGFIGSNGSGKSEFLKCLAAREVPIPDHIDIFFLQEEAQPSDLTPIQSVIGGVERRIKELEAEAEKVLEEEGPESELLADIYDRLDQFEPSTFEARAGSLLHGLGFNKEFMEKKTKDMSGGWRMRVALAEALFVKPTLLLLDEPTNHLDLEACVWLEEYLASYDRCLIVISHSQDFLNFVCTHIIHLTPERKLMNYTGNYNQFLTTKKENEVNQMKRYEKEQADIKHLKAFISSCGTYSNLVRQAKSKQKILDKMEEAGLATQVAEAPQFNFTFAECEKLPPPIMTFENVAFAYSGDLKDKLYDGLNIGVDADSRIALVGPNGAGKSTLLKLMVGDITPTEGQIRRHLHLKIGRYNQHSNDQLDPKKTVLDFIRDTYPDKKLEEQEWRSQIGRYGLGGQLQKTLIGELSDGIKSRVVFCMLAIERPNLLLLDEPTNHLDMECIDALAKAINLFQGGVVLVSHDFRLIDQVAKQVWVCDHKKVEHWKGDIRSYKADLVKKMHKKAAAVAEKISK